jgi:dTMP kinase
MDKSLFVTFEGPEGSGKTTQVKRLARRLAGCGSHVLALREPGGTSIGEQIRNVLHSLDNREMQSRTEILLYCAARAQLVGQVIRPHLESGGVVLCDRYADSTLAYQGYGRSLDLATLRMILDFATGGLKPDLTFYLDIDVEAGLKRKQAGGEEWNRMDDLEVDFYRRVRAGYLEMVAQEPTRWAVIDAAPSAETIAEEIGKMVERVMQNVKRETPNVKRET